MEIRRVGSQPSGEGPAEYFTGTVRIDPLFETPNPHAFVAQASRSSQVPAPPGIHIVHKTNDESRMMRFRNNAEAQMTKTDRGTTVSDEQYQAK